MTAAEQAVDDMPPETSDRAQDENFIPGPRPKRSLPQIC